MKKRLKRILIVFFVVLFTIQFIRPKKNKSVTPSTNDISTKYEVPAEVKNILKGSCYDCHSNNTIYPWYAEVQPVGWWLNNHINEGKRELNFSEFVSYPIRRQYSKLNEIRDQVKKDEMPLKSYLLIHRYAKLNDQQKSAMVNWVTLLRDSIKANYPPDSLLKK
ncbi:MAG: heme-binding domain-containing protein [Ginsengibacter sp.]